MEEQSTIKDIFEGFLIGILSACLIIYGFQTRAEYPAFILNMVNHPWMIIIVVALALVMFESSPHLGALLLLLIIAFLLDIFVFSRVNLHLHNKPPMPDDLKGPTPAEYLSMQNTSSAMPFEEESLILQSINKNDTVSRGAVDAGVSLNSISLPVPNYPMFHAAPDEVRGGPAPF